MIVRIVIEMTPHIKQDSIMLFKMSEEMAPIEYVIVMKTAFEIGFASSFVEGPDAEMPEYDGFGDMTLLCNWLGDMTLICSWFVRANCVNAGLSEMVLDFFRERKLMVSSILYKIMVKMNPDRAAIPHEREEFIVILPLSL